MKEKFEDLTDAEIADMIAEAMGWDFCPPECKCDFPTWYCPNKKERVFKVYEWNPMCSLDQCFIFEEWLINLNITENNNKWMDYHDELQAIYKFNSTVIHATPSQRCYAFLKTMGRVE